MLFTTHSSLQRVHFANNPCKFDQHNSLTFKLPQLRKVPFNATCNHLRALKSHNGQQSLQNTASQNLACNPNTSWLNVVTTLTALSGAISLLISCNILWAPSALALEPLADVAYVGSIKQSPPPPVESQLEQVAPGVYRPLPRTQQSTSQVPVAARAKEVLDLLENARLETQQGKYEQALTDYTTAVQKHGDLAVTEYARIGRALLLYQLGYTSEAIVQLEDCEVALKGNAEIHAALAGILYAERPNQLDRAERQWEVAATFDDRYRDPLWLKDSKYWPPRAVSALSRFLALS